MFLNPFFIGKKKEVYTPRTFAHPLTRTSAQPEKSWSLKSLPALFPITAAKMFPTTAANYVPIANAIMFPITAATYVSIVAIAYDLTSTAATASNSNYHCCEWSDFVCTWS